MFSPHLPDSAPHSAVGRRGWAPGADRDDKRETQPPSVDVQAIMPQAGRSGAGGCAREARSWLEGEGGAPGRHVAHVCGAHGSPGRPGDCSWAVV